MTREQLTAQGYVETAPGVWAKRKPDAVAPVEGDGAERPALCPLGACVPRPAPSAPGVVYSIVIISMRRKLIDEHDALAYAHKSLVDAIAKSLGFSDDSDRALKWEYRQLQTAGEQGTIVRISWL